MTGILTRRLAGMAACGILVLASAAPPDDRKPEAILDDIEAVELPKYDPARGEDRDYIQEYIRQRQEATAQRAELIGELYRAAPDHPKLPELLPERWSALMGSPASRQELDEEIAAIVADEENPLRADAAYFKATLAMRSSRDGRGILDAVESFRALAPDDPRGAVLLYQAAEYAPGLSADEKKALLAQLLDEYPDSPAAERARGSMRQAEAVGKPFELSFNDAISGRTISVQDDLKGKVVVVDFWATWCGPCVAEMPNMKRLYAEYKDKGVEFIGVSLDAPEADGGLEKLKAFVEENEITWPQYYQGNAWDSEFSRSWGINAIPSVFIVDTKGNLHSTEARGRLEQLIPELLAGGSSAGEE